MLWQRVLTALALVPLAVAGILLLDSGVVALLLAGVMLLAANEMGRLSNLRGRGPVLLFVLAVAVALGLAYRHVTPAYLDALQWIMSAWWVLITVSLFSRRRELARVEDKRPTILLVGGLVLLAAWLSITVLHQRGPHGPALVLYLFVLIWVADSGAYFAGRAFGRRKLSPFVSPGKTWAGVGGAVAGATVAAVVAALGGWVGDVALPSWVALSVLVTLVSIGGDLWESRLKREAGVKDSGALLPGHGGVLDRIDSLLAAAPVFVFGLGILGGAA